MPARSASAPAGADPVSVGWARKMLRYTGGSVVATVCSEVTFVALYGPLGVQPARASVVAWLAGAIPNYWLNRSWTWRRRGRPSLRNEVVPYVLIIGLTLLLATVVTHVLDERLRGADTSSSVRVTLVAGAFFAVYAVMFVLRYFLLDRLFGRLARLEAESPPLAPTDPAPPLVELGKNQSSPAPNSVNPAQLDGEFGPAQHVDRASRAAPREGHDDR